MRRLIAATLLTSFLAGPALAADHPGKGQPSRSSGGTTVSIQIGGSDRGIVQEYYGAQIAQGHCPPGLAKKNNGCQPPGQAKKWARGRPLPHDLVYYALPHDLAVRLTAPAGAKYVRVAADILLIAAGSGMVLDAIEDLGRM
jgi:Ni/Co efflux regulator RcnB